MSGAPLNSGYRVAPAFVVGVFLLAFLPRFFGIDSFINLDGATWLLRSTGFIQGLASGELERTQPSSHPGTVLMALVGASVSTYVAVTLLWRDESLSHAFAERPTYVEFHRSFPQAALFAKLPVAIVTAGLTAAIFVVLAKTMGAVVAAGAILFLCTSPFLIGLSQATHLDALSGLLSVLCLLLVLMSINQPDRSLRHLVIAGGVGAFALLTRSFALYTLAFAGLLLAVCGWLDWRATRRRPWDVLRTLIVRYSCFLLVVAGGFFLFLPAMWIEPLAVFYDIFVRPLHLLLWSPVEAPLPVAVPFYFLGELVPNPGWQYYLLVILYRTTPEVLSLVALSLVRLVYEPTSTDPSVHCRRQLVISLSLFAIGFIVALSLFTKKADRYTIPCLITLDIIAGVELMVLAQPTYRWLQQRSKRLGRGLIALGLVALIVPATRLLKLYPYYLSYYNRVVFSPDTAYRTFTIGWGEGLRDAAVYLNALPNADTLTVACDADRQFGPFYVGTTVDLSAIDEGQAVDYIVLSEHYLQRQRQSKSIEQLLKTKPIYTVVLNDLPYVRVYRGQSFVRTPALSSLGDVLGR